MWSGKKPKPKRKPKVNPYVEYRKLYFNQLAERTKINRMLSAEQNSRYRRKVIDYEIFKKKTHQITHPGEVIFFLKGVLELYCMTCGYYVKKKP